jgi:hypothetical protein
MRIFFPSFVLALALAWIPAIAAENPEVDAAQAAAMLWLGTVDSGAYGYGWDDSAEIFQRAVGRGEWEKGAQSARTPLGAVKSRKFRSATPTRKLPGAPEADYVVIYFDTAFENRPSSVEVVTPMKERDGTWKVAGYYIR